MTSMGPIPCSGHDHQSDHEVQGTQRRPDQTCGEKRIAIEKGRVSKNPDGSPGLPWIAVVVDGSWGTRWSYGHRYSSKGGMAGIVVVETKKLLYYGVMNKYCDMCAGVTWSCP